MEGLSLTHVRLAPLCGVTDHVFRTICGELGCETAYTEMISAMGYLCAPNQRATRDLMIRGEKESCLILQLFGREPDIVAEAAAKISQLGLYDGIDLNFGCPAHKIAPSGEGAGMMRTPEKAYEMMRKTVRSSLLPVSVKMRLGWDEDHINAVEIAGLAEEAGIREITVHGRTRMQQYSGKADWDKIQEVAESVHIPVYGNGDLFTARDAVDYARTYQVAGVMIGRGAMGNPWIFRDVKDLNEGRTPTEVTLEERLLMIRKHYRMMLSSRPEPIALREMRKHIGWYLKGIRGAGKARAGINTAETPEEVNQILLALAAENGLKDPENGFGEEVI